LPEGQAVIGCPAFITFGGGFYGREEIELADALVSAAFVSIDFETYPIATEQPGGSLLDGGLFEV